MLKLSILRASRSRKANRVCQSMTLRLAVVLVLMLGMAAATQASETAGANGAATARAPLQATGASDSQHALQYNSPPSAPLSAEPNASPSAPHSPAHSPRHASDPHDPQVHDAHGGAGQGHAKSAHRPITDRYVPRRGYRRGLPGFYVKALAAAGGLLAGALVAGLLLPRRS